MVARGTPSGSNAGGRVGEHDGLLRNLMRSGDRIGHGLALGFDVAAFQERRGRLPIDAGTLLDDLVWLRRELALTGTWLGAWSTQVGKAISNLALRIHREPQDDASLERLLDHRYRTLRPPLEGDPPEARLSWMESADSGLARRRAEAAPECWVETLYGATPFLPDL